MPRCMSTAIPIRRLIQYQSALPRPGRGGLIEAVTLHNKYRGATHSGMTMSLLHVDVLSNRLQFHTALRPPFLAVRYSISVELKTTRIPLISSR